MNKQQKINCKTTNTGFKLPVGDMRKTKTDYDIPTFSFKSSILILCVAIASTILIPSILKFVGISFEMATIVANGLITSYAVAYSRYFIESKKGFCKGFWYTYLMFVIAFFTIGFLWMKMGIYV